MIEVERAAGGVMPRMLGVNHHPEIVNRPRLLVMLEQKFERGDTTREWYEERKKTLTEPIADEWGDRLLHLTSSYTFMGPLRYHLYRLARLRAGELGVRARGRRGHAVAGVQCPAAAGAIAARHPGSCQPVGRRS